MAKLIRNRGTFILACLPIVLAGCQQPLAPSLGQRPPDASFAMADAGANLRLAKVTPSASPTDAADPSDTELYLLDDPQNETLVASVQKEPPSATLQLGDAFVHLLKTFSGH
jgi:hypothetical protein